MFERKLYLDKLISLKDNNKVKVIAGLRRAGKSLLLMNLYQNYLLESNIKKQQILIYSLDTIENIHLRNPFILYETIKKEIKNNDKKYYIFIDEVQLVSKMKNPHTTSKDFITFVDVILSLNVFNNVDLYVTGSNSKMLSTDILTEFRGKCDIINVYPFSYSEITNNHKHHDYDINNYLIYGGMPEIYANSYNSSQAKNYLKDLFKTTYIKDVLERNNIQNNQEILEILLDFIASSTGSLINPSKLANRFLSEKKIKISNETIFSYLNFFEDSFIISKVRRYDIKGAKYFNSLFKYYFTDLGLRNARLSFNDFNEGFLVENLIYNELIKKGYAVNVGMINIDEKRKDTNKIMRKQIEIDFIASSCNTKFYIQSCLDIRDEETKQREIKSLLKINNSFLKMIIVKDLLHSYYEENGILFISLKEFLLCNDLVDLFKV